MLESDLPSQVAQSKLRAEGGTRKGGKSESAATLDCILEMWAEGGKFEKKKKKKGWVRVVNRLSSTYLPMSPPPP